jgi:hypothetical protein
MLKKLFLPKGVQSIDYIMTMTEPWVWDAVITETDEETDIILFTSTGNYTILLVGKEAQDAATVILSSIEELKPGF